MDSLTDALAFLTVLPVGRRDRAPGRGALVAFPLVGLLLGAVWLGAGWAGFRLWGPLPAAALILLIDALVTGGLHLDAVADLADGWASRKPPEGALAVMRDPAIGAVGATVLVATLLCRWSFLTLLVSQAGARRGDWLVLLVAPVIGRATMVWALTAGRPRGEFTAVGAPVAKTARSSLTDTFGAPGALPAAAAGVIAALVGGLAGGWRGLVAVAAGAVLAWVCAAWSRRGFGRLVGDAVGAVGIAAEIVAIALLSARR
jgi:adenosylcobinamide-GDP ribazoletransferase